MLDLVLAIVLQGAAGPSPTELWQAWRANPELTPTAVEEMLRASSVTMHFRRTATRDVEMRGKTIRAGDKVVIWYCSANHDAEGFPSPWRFDLAREKNDHMAFGRNGPHLCLGAWLARMEIRLVFDEETREAQRCRHRPEHEDRRQCRDAARR